MKTVNQLAEEVGTILDERKDVLEMLKYIKTREFVVRIKTEKNHLDYVFSEPFALLLEQTFQQHANILLDEFNNYMTK